MYSVATERRLNKQEIINYHLSGQSAELQGFEHEFFMLDQKDSRIFFSERNRTAINDFFDFLIKNKGYSDLPSQISVGVFKGEAKFTLEPGSQIEYSSTTHKTVRSQAKEFVELLHLLKESEFRLGVKFLNSAHLSSRKEYAQSRILNKERYRIMLQHFNSYSDYGWQMMFNTAALQLSFSFEDKADMEKKVNEMLHLKPILLRLSSNSPQILDDSRYAYSYREHIWNNMNQSRSGEPGEDVWNDGQWTLDKYIQKAFRAPRLFMQSEGRYCPVNKERGITTLEEYILHNSSLFFDIRVKNYVEIRYLDNPGIDYAPGLIMLVEYLFHHDQHREEIVRMLPYSFSDTPKYTHFLNYRNEEAIKIWLGVYTKLLKETVDVILADSSYSWGKKYLLKIVEKAQII